MEKTPDKRVCRYVETPIGPLTPVSYTHLILRLSEQERGVKLFADNGVRVLSQAEVDAL